MVARQRRRPGEVRPLRVGRAGCAALLLGALWCLGACALGDLPGGAKLQFFLTRKGSLGGETPLQALAAGRVAKVKDIAAAFAEEA